MMNDQRARMAEGNSSPREPPSEIAKIPKPMGCEFAEAFSFVNGNGARNSLHVGMPQGESSIFDDDFLVRLEHVRLQMRKRFAGTLRAERRSRRMGSSLEFADFRNYVPGDDPRRIDWSIYGRIERLMMKLYEEEEELDVGILIDCSASMHWRPREATHSAKFVLARHLAAALAYFALRGLDHVALWYFDSGLRIESGRYRGLPAFHDVLRFLRANPRGDATDLSSSLERFGRGRRRRGMAIVLSDFLDSAGFERGLSALVGRHFAVHLVHVMDPAECNPAQTGDLLLRDCESGRELAVTASPGLQRMYRQEFERFRDGLRSWCARHGAGYSFVVADASFDDIILRDFRRDGLVK
jgi:uncharacterized protein (DUF58 family)